MLEPIFSVSAANEPQNKKQHAPDSGKVAKPETVKATRVKKIAKASTANFRTPSVKDALMGRYNSNGQLSSKEQHEMYSNADQKEPFTPENLTMAWNAFVSTLDDRPNLQSTLAYVPDLKENYELYLEIENTVQQNLIDSIKTQLVSWLRKELKNSAIHLKTVISQKSKRQIIYTDTDKFEALLQKNPDLALLKQKLNLDFGQ